MQGSNPLQGEQKMQVITKELKAKLLKNKPYSKPILKLFQGSCTWLVYSMDKSNNDILSGIADLGFGFVEYGTFSLSEIEATRFPPFGLRIERDLFFKGEKTLEEYLSLKSLQGVN
jgi:hypothetical protein